MTDEQDGDDEAFHDDDGGGDGAQTTIAVPRSYLVGQFARTGKALCELGVTYLRIGISFALGADVAKRDEALEKTAETIHILNGTYRALRRVKIDP